MPEPKRELPADPSARAAALAPFGSSADFLLGLADAAAARLPPGRPLSAEEKTAIREPLVEVLWKYDGNMPCEVALLAAVATVAFPRWIEYRAARAAELGAAPAPVRSAQPDAPPPTLEAA